jgi:formate dehydrogenase major subunit/arsenite oxidase large subunit
MDKNANDSSVEVENEIFKTYIANAGETYAKLGVTWEVHFWTPAFKNLDFNTLHEFKTVSVIFPLTEVNVHPDGTVETKGVVE